MQKFFWAFFVFFFIPLFGAGVPEPKNKKLKLRDGAMMLQSMHQEYQRCLADLYKKNSGQTHMLDVYTRALDINARILAYKETFETLYQKFLRTTLISRSLKAQGALNVWGREYCYYNAILRELQGKVVRLISYFEKSPMQKYLVSDDILMLQKFQDKRIELYSKIVFPTLDKIKSWLSCNETYCTDKKNTKGLTADKTWFSLAWMQNYGLFLFGEAHGGHPPITQQQVSRLEDLENHIIVLSEKIFSDK